MPAGFFSLWRLAARRARSRWRLLLPLLVGAVLASGLMSSTAIYGDAVRRLGLERTLASYEPAQLDISLEASQAATNESTYAGVKSTVDLAVYRRVLWFVEGASRGIKGETFYVNQVARGGEAIDPSQENLAGRPEVRVDPRRRAFFAVNASFEDHTVLVAGTAPSDVIVEVDAEGRPKSAPELPVLLLEETARAHGVGVGDRFLLVSFRDEAIPYAAVRVSGIVRPKDPGARYWQSALQRRAAASQRENFAPLFVSQATYLQGVGRLFPKMLSDYSWTLFVDPSRLSADDASLAVYAVEDLNKQLRSSLRNSHAVTELPNALGKFLTKELFGRIPLLIMVMMMVGIVGYYLAMASNVVVDRQTSEVALLRSRGAGVFQVLALYLWEALAISIAAFFLGPLLALGATSAMGLTPAFSGLTDGSALPVKLTTAAYGYALAGAAIAFAAMLLPTLGASRLNPLLHRLGLTRPPGATILTRYYADVFISIIAAVLYWELTQRGSVVSVNLFGGSTVDQALLAAPALFLLAVGLLLLRVFPLAVRLAARLASSFNRVWLVMALWQMGRSPVPYTRPILLLLLASSVAMFAANFGATVNRGYRDRALYASGGDLAVQGLSLPREGPSEPFGARVAAPGAGKAPVFRGDAYRALQLNSSARYDLLAVEPKTFAEVAWHREDLSRLSLAELMTVLEADAPPPVGLLLPQDAEKLQIWVRPATQRRDIQIRARLVDANGRHLDPVLGVMSEEGWQRLEAPLRQLARGRGRPFEPLPPLRLVSLTIQQLRGDALAPGALYLDRVEVSAAGSPEAQTLVAFSEPAAPPANGVQQVQVAHDSRFSAGDSFEVSTSVLREGSSASGLFTWSAGPISLPRGVLLGGPRDAPLLAIASRTAMEREGLSRGDQLALSIQGHLVLVEIAGAVDYFPTMDPFDGGFLVTNLTALLQRINGPETVIDWQPNELWLATGLQGEARQALVRQLSSQAGLVVQDREQLRESFRADPLIAAGWRGALIMAFVAVVAATLLGFAVYSSVRAQERRLEFALLRSLGMSRAQLAFTVMTEQAVVIGLGLGLGALMGYQLTSILMPFLGLTEAGTRVLPPFVTSVNWPAIIATYSAMGAIFLVATLGLIAFFSRMGLPPALRFGESS